MCNAGPSRRGNVCDCRKCLMAQVKRKLTRHILMHFLTPRSQIIRLWEILPPMIRTIPNKARVNNTITLKQLRVATKKSTQGFPPCNDELDKVIAALARCGPDSDIASIPKEMNALDDCLNSSKKVKGKKDTTLYHLSKYIAK